MILLLSVKTEEKKVTSCCPVGLVIRTGLLMHTPADFIELRPICAKYGLQIVGTLSSAVEKNLT